MLCLRLGGLNAAGRAGERGPLHFREKAIEAQGGCKLNKADEDTSIHGPGKLNAIAGLR